MLPRSPVIAVTHIAGLAHLLRDEEEAAGERELTAWSREAEGADCWAIRRGLRGARSVAGSLRMLRLQLLAERWRGHLAELDA
ncbi:MAG: hypothetical protein AB7X49_15665 [Geminicoccaceae bacterium]